MIRTYKRKIILNNKQEKRLRSWIGACRVVYNLGMEVKNDVYKSTGKSIHKYELQKQITELKKDIDWIDDVPSGCLQESIERLEKTYNNFFRTYKKGGGFPKYASKKSSKSITFKSGTIFLQKESIKIPKIGVLKIFKDEKLLGMLRTATIKIEPTGFFIFINCENVPKKFVSENQTIGLDMGISHFCIDSNGKFITNPNHFKKYEDRLRIENRSLARKKKGSNSWVRQAKKLSLLHHKIGNVRKDFLHKESTKIAKDNSKVYMENLNIQGMVKNPFLSRQILDCGWAIFAAMLAYKTTVIKVPSQFTSQTCNECGEVDKKSRLSQSEYVCTSCGHISNADVNAAKNIKSKGIALDRKREPVG